MLGITLANDAYLERLRAEIARLDRAAMQCWSDLIYQAWEHNRSIFVLGNGGSATTASHIAEDFGKSTLRDEELRQEGARRLRILSLTDNVGWITAVGNDLAYDEIFVQQLMNYGREGDLVIAISGSGNSRNVLKAVEWANRQGLVTFGLTGYNGGRLKQIQQHGLHVDLNDMGMVEGIHLCVSHWVLNDVYARIHREGRHA